MPVSELINPDFCDEPNSTALQLAHSLQPDLDQPIFSTVIVAQEGPDPLEAAHKMRILAVHKLLRVVQHCLLASSTGRQIVGLGTLEQQDGGAYDVLNATVGIRSPATLITRANSLLSFLRWTSDSGCVEVNPFTEDTIWRYFIHLKDSGAAPTKMSSAMSAFRFAHFILGVDSLAEVVNSRRLIGLSELAFTSNRLLRQARVLSVAHVIKLHKQLECVDAHIFDRALAAYLLIACYGRCRHSDLQMVHSVECDFIDNGGFIVIKTSSHKAARGVALKTTLMPILVPVRGVNGCNWGPLAMSVLFEAGANLECVCDGPLLCAPSNCSGSLMKRSLTSHEVSMMLRRFLGEPEPQIGCEGDIISSHSLKATTLSWAAKFGLSASTRSMLGRHSCSLNESFAVYSRDLVVAPAVELQSILDRIHEGSFAPDNPRSLFFPSATDSEKGDVMASSSGRVAEVVEVKDECQNADAQVIVDSSEHSCDESVSSDNCGSEDSAVECAPQTRVKRFRARIPEGDKWFNHTKSHILHCLDASANEYAGISVMLCGKRLTDMYQPCDKASEMNVLCKMCLKKKA